MMVRSLLVAVALTLLLPAGEAFAGVWSKGCQFTGSSLDGSALGTASGYAAGNKVIGNGDIGCYRFIAGDTADSGFIHITAGSAVITFDPQLDAPVTVAGAALVIPHLCPQGAALDTDPDDSCPSIGGAGTNANLDGTEGPAGSQNAAIRVGPGVYYFEIAGACAAGDTCQVTVKGESGEE